MAMIERQVFDDTVKGAGAVGGGGGGGSGVSSSGSSSSRNPLRAEAEVCAQCGTTPAAISRADATSAPTASDTGSLPGSSRATVVQSTNVNTAVIPQQQVATASPPSLSVSAPQPAVERIVTSSPIVGMRGGLEGAGGASEPIRGLAAFGSQGSITSSSRNSRGTARQGATASSRLSPRRPASNDPAPRACTCQEGGGGARGGGSGGGGGGRSSGARGTSGGGGGGGTDAGNGSAKRPAARSHSPYRGGNANNGNNGSGGNGGGASSSGPKIPAAAPPRDPGYRVLRWSDLTQLTYMTMGAMCEIYSADLDGVKVAVKVPRSDCEEPAVAEHDLEVELDVLKRVDHKHIIALVGAGNREEKPHRFLVLEFLELGTLADKLDNASNADGTKESTFLRRQKRTKRYQDFYMVTMLERSLELAMALEHLHHHMPETFVVHRDLKPDNVGFKADGTLKLFDFGLARVVKRRNRVNARYEMTGETGSMRYMAPEVVESLPYNEKVDVYAFGLLLWEMLEGNRVFDGMGVADFYERVVNAGARPNLDMSWPQDLRKLISQCWHADVDRRPNFRVIAERLRDLYHREKQSTKLCMSALNLNEGEHPKLRGGSSVNVIVRSATTTNVVGPQSRGGGPSSQTEIGNKRVGVLRRSFSKMGRMFNPKKGGAKATLTHTAPEAYARNGRHLNEPTGGGGGDGVSRGTSIIETSELGDEVIYDEEGNERDGDGGGGSGGCGGSQNTIGVRRAQSDGMIRHLSKNR